MLFIIIKISQEYQNCTVSANGNDVIDILFLFVFGLYYDFI